MLTLVLTAGLGLTTAPQRFAASDGACNKAKETAVEIVRRDYLTSPPHGDGSALPNDVLVWGWVQTQTAAAAAPSAPQANVGYLMISSMNLDGYEFLDPDPESLLPSEWPPHPVPPLNAPTLDPLDPGVAEALAVALDKAAEGLRGASKIVVDVRFNDGGWDLFGLQIAARFNVAAGRVLAGTKQRRQRGKDVGIATDIWIEPGAVQGLTTFDAPAVDVLVSHATCSAAEVFALAMRELPHVRLVGERSCGTLSDEMFHALPNGWRFSLSNEVYRAPDGSCYEAAGLPVDVHVSHCWDRIEMEQHGQHPVDPILEATLLTVPPASGTGGQSFQLLTPLETPLTRGGSIPA